MTPGYINIFLNQCFSFNSYYVHCVAYGQLCYFVNNFGNVLLLLGYYSSYCTAQLVTGTSERKHNKAARADATQCSVPFISVIGVLQWHSES